jgi:nicotinate-nucleotide adenylyltransferase
LARVGILGGTFNPPHIGHIACAHTALVELGLDSVVLMPVASPPHKAAAGDPGSEHRLEMCRRAAAGDERLEVSDIEIRRGGRSYTADTLRALHESHPEDELTFIAGGDMALSLPEWREPETVLELAEFAVAEREGSPREAIEAAVAGLRGAERVRFFAMPRMDVSSTMVRNAIAAGRPYRDLVPDRVADYVEEHGLYRAAMPA